MSKTVQRRTWLAGLAVSSALIGCTSTGSMASPETVFRQWNTLAGAGDAKAANHLCAKPASPTDFDDPITAHPSGFAAARGNAQTKPVELNISVDGDRATIDFTDPGTEKSGDEEDVFVSLVKEAGNWKVCRAQITAAGGIG